MIEEIEMGRATRKLICETLEMDPKTLRRRLRGEETVKRRQRPCPSQERIRERLKVLAEASFDPEVSGPKGILIGVCAGCGLS